MIRKRTAEKCLNRQTKFIIWQQCLTHGTLKQLHASMVVKGFNSNPSALRELIFASAMTVSGAIDYAHRLFANIIEPDIFMWNTMIRGSAQSSKPLNSILYYTQMENRGVLPDDFTFPFLLKACTKLCWATMGKGVHGRVMKLGFESNTFLRNSLIYFHANCGDMKVASSLFDCSAKDDVVAWSALTAGYAKRGDLVAARHLFNEMPIKDLVSWNVMITGYAKRGEMEDARRLFDEVPQRDVVTWNAMIAGYVLVGSHKQAFKMFEEMRSAGKQPDEVTMLSLLSICADLGDLDIAQKLHYDIMEMGRKDLSILLGNALIDVYAKCGSIERSLSVFQDMKEKDDSSWNSILCGLAFNGHAKESIDLFEEMQRRNVRPNEITFVAVLVACSHAGKVTEGRRYYSLMKHVYKIEPNIKHYGCMVDMLGRAGLLKEAFNFVHSMPIEPNAIIWRTLLGACRVHGHVELGKHANENLLRLRRDQSGDYVLLANLYASKGEWDGVEMVRKLMDDSGVKKEPGFSSTEADDKALMQFLFDTKSKSQLNVKNKKGFLPA